MSLSNRFGRSLILGAVACVFAGGALWAFEHMSNASPAGYAGLVREADSAANELRGDKVDLTYAFERVAEVIKPSLVSISSKRELKQPADLSLRFNDGDGLAPFLRHFGMRGQQQPQQERGVGSGVIVSEDGYVLTNNHVVADSSAVQVRLCDGRELTARVVGTDPRTDVAVLKIEASGLRAAELGNSDEVKVGQWVAAFGTPFGLEQTLSGGIVSALGRANMHITDYEDFIQTDAAINPGNSGGPLCDLKGRVIGIDTAIVSNGGGSNGVGLAIPSNMVRSIYERLVRDGRVVRGWLGIGIQNLTPELARSFDFEDAYAKSQHGILVGAVTSSSPAARAGLESGDIITALDGRDVRDVTQFRGAVAEMASGTQAKLALWRDGKQVDVDITVGNAPDQADEGQATPKAATGFGLELSDIDEHVRAQLGLDDEAHGAAIVNVAPGSPADDAGLAAGDVILGVGRKSVADAASAARELKSKSGGSVVLRIQRDGSTVWIEMHSAAIR